MFEDLLNGIHQTIHFLYQANKLFKKYAEM